MDISITTTIIWGLIGTISAFISASLSMPALYKTGTNLTLTKKEAAIRNTCLIIALITLIPLFTYQYQAFTIK